MIFGFGFFWGGGSISITEMPSFMEIPHIWITSGSRGIWTIPVVEKLEIQEPQSGAIVNPRGMGIVVTGLFIVGEMAGGGIVAMPQAMEQTSWSGIAVIVVGAILTGYTGSQLGWCWAMLQEMWPEYRKHTRKPYPAIGERAMGLWAKHSVSVCIDITLFGSAVVFLLLASENISELIKMWTSKHVSFCILLLAVAGVLLPVTWLGSPKDFWPAVVGAMISTTTAVVLILVGTALDRDKLATVQHDPVGFVPYSLAFATIAFAYGGHSAFPTIQHDMKTPSKFPQSVFIAYVMLAFYLPVAVAGFAVYGKNVHGNILTNISTSWCEDAVTVLITLHVLLSYIILINPVNQELEEVLRVPKSFNKWRILSRTVMMVAVLFVAETIPRFGAVLDLIGGSTITVLTFIFPCLFYMFLTRMHSQRFKSSVHGGYFALPWYTILLNVVIIALGLVGGVAATYAAVSNIIHPTGGRVFTMPCYVNASDAA